jgi:hypothetical protein
MRNPCLVQRQKVCVKGHHHTFFRRGESQLVLVEQAAPASFLRGQDIDPMPT